MRHNDFNPSPNGQFFTVAVIVVAFTVAQFSLLLLRRRLLLWKSQRNQLCGKRTETAKAAGTVESEHQTIF